MLKFFLCLGVPTPPADLQHQLSRRVVRVRGLVGIELLGQSTVNGH
ncbi:hypothetical protein [Streptomyces sp. NPDC005784]